MMNKLKRNPEYFAVVFLIFVVVFLMATAITVKSILKTQHHVEDARLSLVAGATATAANYPNHAYAADGPARWPESTATAGTRLLPNTPPPPEAEPTSWWERTVFHVLNILIISKEVEVIHHLKDNWENRRPHPFNS